MEPQCFELSRTFAPILQHMIFSYLEFDGLYKIRDPTKIVFLVVFTCEVLNCDGHGRVWFLL